VINTTGCEPEKINTDKNASYPPDKNKICPTFILTRIKFLNNLVERDNQSVKKRLRTIRGLKSYDTGVEVLAGIESIHELYQKQGLKGTVIDEAVYKLAMAT